MTAADLNGWAEYEQQERWGWRPDLIPFADLMALVANVNRTKGEPLTRDDFLPHPQGSHDERPADLASRVRAGGGVVMGLPALVSISSHSQPEA